MGHDIFKMTSGNGSILPGGESFPVDVCFGESSVAIPCSVCRRISNVGFFVLHKGRAMLCCVKCIVTAIMKYQSDHPNEKFFDVDVDISESDYKYAVKALREKKPELSEEDALDIAKIVVRAIG